MQETCKRACRQRAIDTIARPTPFLEVQFRCRSETWPLKSPFVISRERLDSLPLAFLEIEHDGAVGRAEAAGVDYRGETPDSICAAVTRLLRALDRPPGRDWLCAQMPPGGARNLLDCALWDWEVKRFGRSAYDMARIIPPSQLTTAFTLSLATPQAMGVAALSAPAGAPLKLKLGGRDGLDIERVRAVRESMPAAVLIVDVNEGWTLEGLQYAAPLLADLGVALIEQPLPAGRDADLDRHRRLVPLCADESFDDASSLAVVRGRYDCINIKLDKAGGLTAALIAADRAAAEGFDLFVGSMLGTSLGMAPAYVVAAKCRWVDLDGPLLLARDREDPIIYDGSTMFCPPSRLWG